MLVGTTIKTVTGQHVSLITPLQSTLRIEDIAHGLARCVRYAGQRKQNITVAEHSIRVMASVAYERSIDLWGDTSLSRSDANLLKAALLHDAAEAYLGDLTSPLKALCKDYQLIEKRLQQVIYDRFGVDLNVLVLDNVYPRDVKRIVKLHDERALLWESGDLETPPIPVSDAARQNIIGAWANPFLDMFEDIERRLF